MAIGKQVRLFLSEGTVGGLMTAEILNWTGHMLRARRKDLSTLRTRPEAGRTGVYILLGTSGEDIKTAYIGEGDNVVRRLEKHHTDPSKEFWEDVVIITSKDMNLTKAHVRFLESELISLARRIGRYHLVNGNAPSGGAPLPEADQSDMKYFIEQIRILMPVLGFDIFRGRAQDQSISARPESEGPGSTSIASEEVSSVSDSPVFYLTDNRGANARAQYIDGEFTVLEGSLLPATMHLSEQRKAELSPSTVRRHESIEAHLEKVLETTKPSHIEGRVVLTKDYVFASPSLAGGVVRGRVAGANRREWKTAEGITLLEWEESS